MKLHIVGAGGFGREVYGWARDCPEWGKSWDFAGFLDDGLEPGTVVFEGAKVVGGIKDFSPSSDDLLISGLGNIKRKRTVLPLLLAKSCRFATMIHPSAVIGRNVQLGIGAVICPYSVLTCDISIGNFCSLNLHCTIGHDVVAGDLLHMNSHSDITGNCRLGDGVFVGSHAFILQGKSVGNDAVIGAGSVVIRSVKDNVTVFGNPAVELLSK